MIGIDVGGANLKVVDDAGASYPLLSALGKGTPYPPAPDQYVSAPDEPAAVVMSGELADCFENKMEGISFIVDAVRKAFPAARFYGTDARFHNDAVPRTCRSQLACLR